VKPTDTSVAIITHLLDKIDSLNVNIKTLYLDRGFFSISVIRWLKALEIPFIRQAIRRGKKVSSQLSSKFDGLRDTIILKIVC
jgi:putative transposase